MILRVFKPGTDGPLLVCIDDPEMMLILSLNTENELLKALITLKQTPLKVTLRRIRLTATKRMSFKPRRTQTNFPYNRKDLPSGWRHTHTGRAVITDLESVLSVNQ